MLNKSILSMSQAEVQVIAEEWERLLDRSLFDLQQHLRLVDIGELLGIKKSQAGHYINGNLPARHLAVIVLAMAGNELTDFLNRIKGRVGVNLPGSRPEGTISKETGEFLSELGKAMEDGEMKLDELRRLKSEVSDLYGAVSAAEAAAMERRR